MDKKQILLRIDQLMKEKGVTKYELKEDAGISSTIYQWRKNATRDKERIPSLRSIEKICEFFNVSLSYFFAFDSERKRTLKNEELEGLIELLSDEQVDLIISLIKEILAHNINNR